MNAIELQLEWVENRDAKGHITEGPCPHCNGPSVHDDEKGPQPCLECLEPR